MKTTPNKPYVKVYDEFGVLTNQITKENPYLGSWNAKNAFKKHFRMWQTVRNAFFTGKTIVKV